MQRENGDQTGTDDSPKSRRLDSDVKIPSNLVEKHFVLLLGPGPREDMYFDAVKFASTLTLNNTLTQVTVRDGYLVGNGRR